MAGWRGKAVCRLRSNDVGLVHREKEWSHHLKDKKAQKRQACDAGISE